jgi:hypothetical protein
MKYFITTITILHEAQEYGEQLLVKAMNDDDAKNKTEAWLLDVYCDDHEERWKDDELELFEQIIRFDDTREIPGSDYFVLQKYLTIVNEAIYSYK